MNTVFIASSTRAIYIGLNDNEEWIWVRHYNSCLKFGTKTDAMAFIRGNPVLSEAYDEGAIMLC